MEKLKQRLRSCQRALATLDEAVNMPFSVIVRDASIQRFEYSSESLWKLLKAHLEQYEGILCNSPGFGPYGLDLAIQAERGEQLAYAYDVEWGKLRPLVEGMGRVLAALRAQIEAFLGTMAEPES